MATDEYDPHSFVYEGRARHVGRIGDAFVLDADAVEYSKSRCGSGPQISLQVGDVIVKQAFSGDCFCYYAVYRDGTRLNERWCGYEGVGRYVGNIAPPAPGLPGRLPGL